MERYELVVVGGGMTGLTLVAALQPAIEQGMKVALIDPAQKPNAVQAGSPSFDDRATALSAQTLTSLQDIHLPGLEPVLSNIKRIEVSDQGHVGYHEMTASQAGFDRYGAVIANRALGSLLWQRTQNLPIDWHFETEVNAITPLAQGHRLTLSKGTELEAGLVLLCDGGRSSLAQRLGFHVQQKPFHAHARVATVKTSQPHEGCAFERFTASGPIALLPFGEYSALVWTLPDAQLSKMPSTRETALQWLNEYFGQRLGTITDISDWQDYPLTEKTIDMQASHGLLVLGNSAATLHPVAGQGFNLAIRGLMRAARLICQVWRDQKTLPDFAQLNSLAGDILSDQQQTVLFSRELINTFGSHNPLLQLGRGIALGSLDRHPSCSKTFALASMGLLAGTPTLSGFNKGQAS